MFRSSVASCTLLAAGLMPASLRSQPQVSTPDVHLLARTIQAEIEVLRWHMGRPAETRDAIPVENVAIRENFRQAMTLWSKINQLGVELVGGGEPPPVVTLTLGARYGPRHVHQVLTGALARLQEIREGIGVVGLAPIEEAASEPTLDPRATPSDVFQSIVQSNRQVNRMLERQVQPGDVYQQVQQAIFYASEILAALGDPNPYPAAPEYEPGRRPAHVYGRLLLVFDRLSVGFAALGLNMVNWIGSAYEIDEATLQPSDVFDLATLLLSELEHLHSLVPGARVPLQVAHPGLRWPSDVYQQAGILSDQASRIMAYARENPDMLVASAR